LICKKFSYLIPRRNIDELRKNIVLIFQRHIYHLDRLWR